MGHEISDWKIVIQPEWFTEGKQIKKCIVCNEILEEEIIPQIYPTYYLYIAIGVVALMLLAIIALTINMIRKKKRVSSN